jgi:hypothetical protein
MKQRIVLSILVFGLMTISSIKVFANGGPVEWNSNTASGDLLVEAKTQISLLSEVLHIQVINEHYKVKAKYTLSNPGPAKVITFGVPLSSNAGYEETQKTVSVRINGKVHRCTKRVGEKETNLFRRKSLSPQLKNERGEIASDWCLSRIPIPKGDAIPLTLTYTGQLEYVDWETNKDWRRSYAPRVLFYKLSPAGYWAGKIRRLAIHLDLGPHAAKAKIKGPPGYKREGQKLTWNFQDVDLKTFPHLYVSYDLDKDAIRYSAAALEQTKGQKIPWHTYNLGNAKFYPSKEHITVKASSSLKGKKKNAYGVDKLMDGDLKTAWCEGAQGPGLGEWIEVRIKNLPPVCDREGGTWPTFMLVPGYAKSKRLWSGNNRVIEATVERCDVPKDKNKYTWKIRSYEEPGVVFSLLQPGAEDPTLAKTPLYQVKIDLAKGKDTCVRFKIDKIEPGDFKSSNDTCISELLFTARCWFG